MSTDARKVLDEIIREYLKEKAEKEKLKREEKEKKEKA